MGKINKYGGEVKFSLIKKFQPKSIEEIMTRKSKIWQTPPSQLFLVRVINGVSMDSKLTEQKHGEKQYLYSFKILPHKILMNYKG